MKNPLKRNPSRYEDELRRLLEEARVLHPATDEYVAVLKAINELDKINNRTSEFKKTVIPAAGTVGGVVGIYALQQFAGVLIPKALEALPSRSNRTQRELD
jgi:hypothetical protein